MHPEVPTSPLGISWEQVTRSQVMCMISHESYQKKTKQNKAKKSLRLLI